MNEGLPGAIRLISIEERPKRTRVRTKGSREVTRGDERIMTAIGRRAPHSLYRSFFAWEPSH